MEMKMEYFGERIIKNIFLNNLILPKIKSDE